LRVINLKESAAKPLEEKRITVMSYGAPRSGKTEFAGTFPKPLFLASGDESGWTTLESIRPEKLYDRDVQPLVWAIDQPSDMMQAVGQLDTELKKDPKKYGTVVIDSVTFYGQLFLSFLESSAASNPKEQGLRVFLKFQQHMQLLAQKVHALPCNVVWLALAKEPGEGESAGGIALTGQSAKLLPARCDYWFYQRAWRLRPEDKVSYTLHTRGYSIYPAGGRDGGALPDTIEDVSYRGIIAALKKGKADQAAQAAPVPAAAK
jgi:hypothetical protein